MLTYLLNLIYIYIYMYIYIYIYRVSVVKIDFNRKIGNLYLHVLNYIRGYL